MTEIEHQNVFKQLNSSDLNSKRPKNSSINRALFSNPMNANNFTFGKGYNGKKLKFKQSLAYQMHSGGKSLRDYFDLKSLRSESEGNSSCVKSRDKTKATSGHQSIRSKKFQKLMIKYNREGRENSNPNIASQKEKSGFVIFNTPTKSFKDMKKESKATGITCELCTDKSSEYLQEDTDFNPALEKDIDMLKCGHIFCLDCILDKKMTYSECFVCKNTESVILTPNKAVEPCIFGKTSVRKEKLKEDVITIMSESGSEPIANVEGKLFKKAVKKVVCCDLITVNKSNVSSSSDLIGSNC
jgi:hypothetical protein